MTVQWGIISTGLIANAFADALQQTPNANLLAVGSRSQASADTFGDQYNIPRRYASYEDLVADPDIDIVYIGTPHVFHAENMRLCLENGKHILCEKPFTMNAQEAADVIALAREKGLFLMEAMWVRYLPAIKHLREILAEGIIGTPLSFQGDFYTYRAFEADHRLFAPELGGGALLDLGVYPLSFAAMLFGDAVEATAVAVRGQTDVDEMFSASVRYENNALAAVSAGFRINGVHRGTIIGTDGYIEIAPPFYECEQFTVYRPSQKPLTYTHAIEGNKYHYQAIEATHCVQQGKQESDAMTLDQTLDIMQTMDSIREQWGLRYPGE